MKEEGNGGTRGCGAANPKRRAAWRCPWLLAVVGGFAVLGLGGAVLLMPLMVSTPAGVEPVVKVRGLDLIQARALAASARRLAANGQAEAACLAWEQAIHRNPGDARLRRSVLGLVAESPDLVPEIVARVLGQAPRFLKLTGTNAPDLELVVRAGVAHDANDLLCSLLDPLPPPLPRLAAVARARARALLRSGRAADFQVQLHRLALAGVEEPELAPFRQAWIAGWGEAAERRRAFARLRAAFDQRQENRTLAKLLLLAAARLGEAGVCRRALERLTAEGCDTPFDHAQLWRALRVAGQGREAWELARNFYREPVGPAGVLAVAREFRALGLIGHCSTCLKRGLRRFGRQTSDTVLDLCVFAAEYFMRERQWLEVEALAETLRGHPQYRSRFRGYVAFLEGCAAWGKVYPDRAEARFQEAVVAGFPDVEAAAQAGITLMQLRRPALALAALRPHEARLDEVRGAWQAVWNSALTLHQDAGLLLKAARKLHAAAPRDETARLNLAAALMITRENPTEALALTWDLYTVRSNSLAVVLNHALALAQNGRAADAATLLSPLNPARLTLPERSSFYLARLEISALEGRTNAARLSLAGVDRSSLFPPQLARLQELADRLDPEPPAAPRIGRSETTGGPVLLTP